MEGGIIRHATKCIYTILKTYDKVSGMILGFLLSRCVLQGKHSVYDFPRGLDKAPKCLEKAMLEKSDA